MPQETKGLKVADVEIPISIPQTSLKLGRKKKNSLVAKNEASLKCIYNSSTNYQYAPVMGGDAQKTPMVRYCRSIFFLN